MLLVRVGLLSWDLTTIFESVSVRNPKLGKARILSISQCSCRPSSPFLPVFSAWCSCNSICWVEKTSYCRRLFFAVCLFLTKKLFTVTLLNDALLIYMLELEDDIPSVVDCITLKSDHTVVCSLQGKVVPASQYDDLAKGRLTQLVLSLST